MLQNFFTSLLLTLQAKRLYVIAGKPLQLNLILMIRLRTYKHYYRL